MNHSSPTKRKLSEYRDPDYCRQCPEEPERPTSSKRYKAEKSLVNAAPSTDRASQLIEKIFDEEITINEQLLSTVNDRIEEAKLLLDRVRYAVVAKYYKDQESKVADPDVAAVSDSGTVKPESKAPPKALHPALTKLVGKKPRDLSELLRETPQRAAAQTAQSEIRKRIKKPDQSERRLMQKIKKEGIVIDHSKQTSIDAPSKNVNDTNVLLLNAINLESRQRGEVCDNHSNAGVTTTSPKKPVVALNSARLNNKVRHLIVVGNTSKYIGHDAPRTSTSSAKYTHKWMVYVQHRDTKESLSKYIEMVRFYLHPSYKPNDVVDVRAEPFQISRHGWGEFPIRVQIFFHAKFHQKPLQFAHNLVLDKTLTGLQTMGAETLVEVWLRDKVSSTTRKPQLECEPAKPIKEERLEEQQVEEQSENAHSQGDKTEDENMYNFLKSIGIAPAYIGECSNTQSAELCPEPTPIREDARSPQKCELTESEAPIELERNSTQNGELRKNSIKDTAANGVENATTTHTSSSAMEKNESNSSMVHNPTQSAAPKANNLRVLQKKVIPYVDATGTVKYMQVLVPTTITLTKPIATTTTTATVAPQPVTVNRPVRKAVVSSVQKVDECKKVVNSQNAPESWKKTTPSGNIVFQKAGKLFIIDPAQTRLKQQQKKQQQVSLLKPQISLLKANAQKPLTKLSTDATKSSNSDHDYTTNQTNVKLASSSTTLRRPNDGNTSSIHIGMRQTRMNALSCFEQFKLRRNEFERQFHHQIFSNVRSAVEYLLRKLPLIAERNTIAGAFSFVHYTQQSFQTAPVFKQRSCEWLRAKLISKYIANHKSVRELSSALWTTCEIVIYARVHGYTPTTKALKPAGSTEAKASDEKKTDTKEKWNEDIHSTVITLTSSLSVENWLEKVFGKIRDYETASNDNEMVDVMCIDEKQSKSNYLQTALTASRLITGLDGNECVIRPPQKFENEYDILKSISKALGCMWPHERIEGDVWLCSVETVLVQCLRLFIETIVRHAVAIKVEEQQTDTFRKKFIECPEVQLKPTDIIRAIVSQPNLDFLTNKHFGVNFIDPDVIKQEHKL